MDEERSREINSVILKGVGLLVALGVVVALGTVVVVHVLGLNDTGSDGSVLGEPAPVTPLPSSALPVPHSKSAHPSDHTSGTAGAGSRGRQVEGAPGARGLRLSISPLVAGAMERLNLTGTYRGHDNAGLQVQRLEGGTWADFPTQAQVSMGTFETYVMTSQTGVNRFRVLDPASGKASNVVEVTIH